ncbi:MAG: Rieske 2Fe-2S domain-containing protein, partial [Sphingomonadaceae bacterium]
MTWLRNTWYQAGWADELMVGTPLVRTLLNEPILLYRQKNGDVAALLDRCPHRFVPLSAGTIEKDIVTCPYHGLAFGPKGNCVVNPHGAITSTMAVRSYPVLERHDAIWIWTGEADAADDTKIPDLAFLNGVPESAQFSMYIPTAANYQLLLDNIMDLSHADYIHSATLGGMMTDAKISSREDGDRMVVEWVADNCVPAPAFAPMIPVDSRADVWIDGSW